MNASAGDMKKTLLIILGLALLAVPFLYFDTSLWDVFTSLENIDYSYLGLSFVFQYIGLLMLSYRWQAIVQSAMHSLNLPLKFFFLCSCFSVVAGGLSPSVVGNVTVKVGALYKVAGVAIEKGLSLVFVEHGLGVFIALIMMSPCLILMNFADYDVILNIIYFSLVIVFLALLFKSWKKVFTTLLWYAIFFARKLKITKKFARMLARTRILLNASYSQVLYAVSLTFIIYVINIAGYYAILLSLGIYVSPIKFFLMFPVIYLITMMAPTPDGLGFRDVGWVGILVFLGVDESSALTYSILTRVIDKVFMASVFMLSSIFSLIYGKDFLTKQA